MRIGFVLLRLAGYLAVFAYLLASTDPLTLWQWLTSVAIMAWAISEHLKRPQASQSLLRTGVWTELVLIILWSIALHSNIILFLTISPIIRSDVHLLCKDAGILGAVTGCAIFTEAICYKSYPWTPWVEAIVIGGLGLHGFLLGSLLRERTRLARLERLALEERTHRLRQEERMKLAGELHDVMGQHWTAVIRGLDAVSRTEGQVQRELIDKVQAIAAKGLSEMRTAVHDGYDGRRSCEAWLALLQESISRWRDVAYVTLDADLDEIDWYRCANPELTAEVAVRTAIEAMTNAIRHSDVIRLHVALTQTDQHINVVVENRSIHRWRKQTDTGAARSGTGIREMRRLAALVGGHLEWDVMQSGSRTFLSVPHAAVAHSEAMGLEGRETV